MFHTTSKSFDVAGVNSTLDALEQRCRAFEQTTGPDAKFVAMSRYGGALPRSGLGDRGAFAQTPVRLSTDIDDLLDDFHNSHQEIFAVSDPISNRDRRLERDDPLSNSVHPAPAEFERPRQWGNSPIGASILARRDGSTPKSKASKSFQMATSSKDLRSSNPASRRS